MTNKIVLDCETFETALNSLASIFQTTPDILHSQLSAEEIATCFETHWRELPDFGEYLYSIVEKYHGDPLSLDAVCWFHTTRILPGTVFSEGILPLNAALPLLKEMLIQAIDDLNIREQLRRSLESGCIADFHYSYKTQNSIHWGPYGILVKEVAFHSQKLSQHDYLAMPEIIEDICNGFQKTSGIDLMPEYSAKLKPAIIKFVHPNNSDELCLAAALCYVYSQIHSGAPCSNSVFCFDGENNPVPPQHILKMEIVELAHPSA
ncbi:hypothetical protein [uncultured Deefgea sp.]|uniref:hypothetical protein n=1 Tax=uncultured Deefgea sp. TaxID=1304914 RepID=UPI00261B0D16|nr:hypothetical protein [uncultured Deefgea sp.]